MEGRVSGSKEAVEKVKSMQIKRVTTQQVVTIVDDWGQKIVKQAQANLEKALATPSTETASLCQLKKLPPIDSLEKLYTVEIDLLGTKDVTNPSLSVKEQQILDAYVYNAENKISQIPNIQKLGDTALVYNAPIPLQSSICYKCFAEDATHLAVWRVKFKRNEVIRKVNAKSLAKIKQN
jgi:hypothetical protein